MQGCAHPNKGAPGVAGVVSDEASKRPNPSACTNQDQWRLAAGGAECGILADKRLDPAAVFELVQKTRTLAARMFAHANLNHAIVAGGCKRIKPRQIAPRRQDANQVTGLKLWQAGCAQPPPEALG